MKVTTASAEAVNAFDYSFSGKLHQEVYCLIADCLPLPCNIGALLGLCGTGKSVNMRTYAHGLLCEAAIDF